MLSRCSSSLKAYWKIVKVHMYLSESGNESIISLPDFILIKNFQYWPYFCLKPIYLFILKNPLCPKANPKAARSHRYTSLWVWMAKYLPLLLVAFSQTSEGLSKQFKERPIFFSFQIHVLLSSTPLVKGWFGDWVFAQISTEISMVSLDSVFIWLCYMWFVSATLDSCYFFLVG